MIKCGVTKTLQESLMLESRLNLLYSTYDKTTDEKEKVVLLSYINSVKKRMYKLPNYNINGLTKIMKFFKVENNVQAV